MTAVRTLLALLTLTAAALAQGKSSDTVVKATAKADGGTVTITLEIDPKYHVYANPIGNKDLEDTQTTVTLSSKGKLGKVDYPAGELVKDKVVGDYKVYHGKVQIKAAVDGPGPHEFAIKVQACSKSACLLPATLKVTAP